MTENIPSEPKIRSRDNPWYLLATLYGEPTADEHELQARNRTAWNRYMAPWRGEFAAQLDADTRRRMEPVGPFEQEELPDVQRAFIERHRRAGSAAIPILPELKQGDHIDFSNIQFDRSPLFDGFIFPLPSRFNRSTFSQHVSFKVFFLGEVYFEDATFSAGAVFDGTTFLRRAYFKGATFSDTASFRKATFSAGAVFGGATFSGIDFSSSTFCEDVSFESALFSEYADFSRVSFSRSAFFIEATFAAAASFWRATFSEIAYFGGTTFSEAVLFADATFSSDAGFQRAIFRSEASFINATMEAPTSFETAVFNSEPPRFFGAKLHEGTVWRNVTWPAQPPDYDSAGRFIDAYERLKLEMDRLKRHEDELNFFALELRSRRRLAGTVSGFPIAIYGVLCDYGRSYIRPLLGLLVTIAVGAVLGLPHSAHRNIHKQSA